MTLELGKKMELDNFVDQFVSPTLTPEYDGKDELKAEQVGVTREEELAYLTRRIARLNSIDPTVGKDEDGNDAYLMGGAIDVLLTSLAKEFDAIFADFDNTSEDALNSVNEIRESIALFRVDLLERLLPEYLNTVGDQLETVADCEGDEEKA